METAEVLKALEGVGIQTNAAPMGTGKTNEGAELVPDEVFANEVFDMIPTYGKFLDMLPGNHSRGGRRLDKVAKVPVIGDAGFFAAGSEKTSGAFALSAGSTVATDEITITQAKYTMKLDVTDELETFSRYPEQLQTVLKQKIAMSAARTIEALIINGDAETGSTGNVNLDDAAPTSGTYYLNNDHGLREVSINNSYTTSVGTFEFADLTAAFGKLGGYINDPASLLWLFNAQTYAKALGITEFKDAAQNGKGSTIHTGALTNILGSDLVVARDIGLTEADGKISTTAGNNTLGQFIVMWKPVVQFGFGKELQMKVFDMGADGYQLHAWFYFGFALAYGLSGQNDTPLWTGINVTVA